MMKFEDPRLEVLSFVVEDIVTVSGGFTEGNDDSSNFGDLYG